MAFENGMGCSLVIKIFLECGKPWIWSQIEKRKGKKREERERKKEGRKVCGKGRRKEERKREEQAIGEWDRNSPGSGVSSSLGGSRQTVPPRSLLRSHQARLRINLYNHRWTPNFNTGAPRERREAAMCLGIKNINTDACPRRKVTVEKTLNEEPLLTSQPALGPWQKWQLLLRKKRRRGWSTRGHWFFFLSSPQSNWICFLQA